MSPCFKTTAWFLYAILLCLFSQGCVKDRAELEKEIIARDPSFQKTLDRRNSLRRELDSRKIVFLKKQQEIDSRINALKNEKTQARREYSSHAGRIKRQIHLERSRLQRELIDMKQKYKQKERGIRNIDRNINEINALIKRKDELALSQEEIRVWNDRLASLIEKKQEISSELDKLQAEIRTMKSKIKVLKL